MAGHCTLRESSGTLCSSAQFLPPSDKAKYPDPDKLPLNSRQRALASKPAMPVAHYHAHRLLDLSNHVGSLVEVVLPVEEVTRAARAVRKRHIWGDKLYTADTDLFAALVHLALLPAKCAETGWQWPDAVVQVRCILRAWPPQRGYKACLRNGMRSRAWPNRCCEFAYEVERAWLIVRVMRPRSPLLCRFAAATNGPLACDAHHA